MQSSSQGRYGYPGYQGYPYVNPVVHDVPSIDAQTASRWANLPRRPMQDGPSVAVIPGTGSASYGSGSSSQTTQSSSQDRQTYSKYRGYPYVNPVYNDVSGSISPDASGGSGLSGNSSQAAQRPQTPSATTTNTNNETSNDTVPPKKDIDENPVVYIDIPEAGSEVSRSIESPDDDEPEFVQNTIMYDPFENRRIDMPKDDERSAASSESGSTSAYTPQYQNARPIPMRPNTLNLAGGSGSSSQSPASSSRQTPGVPSFMSKESQIYGGSDGADGFPLSPIPISEFPEPPPAYTEVAETPAPQEPVREPPRVVEPPPPPRTQVIVNEHGSQMSPVSNAGTMSPVPIGSPMSPVPIGSPMSPVPIVSPMGPMVVGSPLNPMPISNPVNSIIGRQNIDQKYLICHHCGARVHTIVQKENGGMTHFIACLIFFIFLPFVLIVYCSDYFKYKNHYCPSCFKLIGYETPIVGEKVNYVT